MNPVERELNPLSMSRRGFMQLALAASGGLVLCHFPEASEGKVASKSWAIGTLVRIDPDGAVVIGSRAPEIGQGVKTSLPMILAEEMDADWSRVRVEQLPLGIRKKDDGTFEWKYCPQSAGGSTSVPEAWGDLRQAGAQVRYVLVQAAAAQWQIDATKLRTEAGFVIHPDGRRLGYGELAAAAAMLPLSSEPLPLKQPPWAGLPPT